MALGSSVKARVGETGGSFVVPVSAVGEWVDVIDAGGVDDQDNSGTITNPDTHIDGTDHHDLAVEDNGVTPICLSLRLVYDDGDTPETDPVLQVFGRTGDSGPWQRLQTREDTPSADVTLTTAASTDVTDGTYKYTTAGMEAQTVDTGGCNRFRFGVKTAYAVSEGDATLARVQAKVF